MIGNVYHILYMFQMSASYLSEYFQTYLNEESSYMYDDIRTTLAEYLDLQN